MKNATILTSLFMACSFSSISQITSNPGINNWTSPSAWAGGVVPTATDDVIIGMNSTINLDVPIVHNANIDLNGGTLASMNPANDLVVNNSNITIVGFSSILNFAGSGAPVPVTINNGHLINGGVFMAGNTYISYGSTGTESSNDGDFMVMGDLTIDDTEVFENNLGMSVNGTMNINVDAEYYNNMSASTGVLYVDGIFENLGTYNVTDSIVNNIAAEITSDGDGLFVTNAVSNAGYIYIYDSLQIGTHFNNFMVARIECDSAAVNITTDLYNLGSITGDGGYYYIGLNSTNEMSGNIYGNIDVCDATLLPATYLDVDNGTANIDFNTVEFCMVSYASTEDLENNLLEVYPNPALNKISITGLDAGTVSVVSNDGRIISVNEISNSENTIDIKSVPSGVYFIVVETNEEVITKKLIKL